MYDAGLKLEVDEGLHVGALHLKDALQQDNEGDYLDRERGSNVSFLYFMETIGRNGVDDYGDNHEPYKETACLVEDREDGPIEIGEYVLDHQPGGTETVGAEEYPQCYNEMDCQ